MTAADLLFINLNKATSYAIELFREELRGQGHRSSGRLEESFAKVIEIKVNEAKGIITAEEYGIYLDKGVAANKVKYAVDVLFPWIKRIKPGISVSEMTSLAYAIRAVHKKKGIPASKFNSVFKPGYSTKKRGWGLGLSLTKRIIKNYHNGKVFVKQSEVGEGTTFRIQLPKL